MSDDPRRSEIFGQNPAMPTRNVMKDDFDFVVPAELVPLPSRGIIYPHDSPLFGQIVTLDTPYT